MLVVISENDLEFFLNKNLIKKKQNMFRYISYKAKVSIKLTIHFKVCKKTKLQIKKYYNCTY